MDPRFKFLTEVNVFKQKGISFDGNMSCVVERFGYINYLLRCMIVSCL